MPGQLTGRDPLNQSLYLWAKGVLPNYIISVLGNRMEMPHSIEGRQPFLDHHVVGMIRRYLKEVVNTGNLDALAECISPDYVVC